MPLPQHPEHIDAPSVSPHRTKRAIMATIGLITLLASLHFLRQAL